MKPTRVVLLSLALIGVCSGAEPRVYTVCEILERLEDFSCRMVRMKARLESGTDSWLFGDDCPKRVQVNGIKFGPAMTMRWPDSLLAGCNVDFASDEESYKRVYAAINSAEGRTRRIDVLIDGVVETRKPPHALVSRNGAPIGFGHLGSTAAQIIVKRVVDLRVTPKK